MTSLPEVMLSSANLHTPSLIRDDEKEQIFCSSQSLHKNDPSSSSTRSKPTSPFLKEEKTIIFPKLEKVENSIIIINSKTEGIDIDELCRVRTTTPVQMSTEEENIIPRKLCDDHLNPSLANFNEKENYSVSSPIFKEEKEAQSNPELADDEQSNPIPEDTNTSPDTKSRKFIVPKTTSVTINKGLDDDVAKNLFLAKKSKRRLFKWQNLVRSLKRAKLAMKNLRTHFQIRSLLKNGKRKNRLMDLAISSKIGTAQSREDKRTGKKYQLSRGVVNIIFAMTSSNVQVIKMINRCTIDCLLQMLLTFYSLNIVQMQRLFLNNDTLLQKVGEVVQHLLTSDFSTAKYIWLTDICKLSANSNGIIDAFDNDKMISQYPIGSIFIRKYQSSTCSSEYCPLSGSEDNDNEIDSTTLHYPDAEAEHLLHQSIREYELGTSSSALISWKGEFDQEPNHDQYISEKDNDRDIIRCAGWRNPVSLTFGTKPPFLLFDLSSLFSSYIVDLSMISKDIYVYNDHYLEEPRRTYQQGVIMSGIFA